MRSQVLAVTVIALVSLTAGGCTVTGTDPDRQGADPDPEVLLRETLDDAFTAAGLDPADAKVERLQNPCIGATGDEGWNISYYLVMSRAEAIDALEKVEAHWKNTPDIDVYQPLRTRGWIDMLASKPPLALEAVWYTASRELAVGGSTPCS